INSDARPVLMPILVLSSVSHSAQETVEALSSLRRRPADRKCLSALRSAFLPWARSSLIALISAACGGMGGRQCSEVSSLASCSNPGAWSSVAPEAGPDPFAVILHQPPARVPTPQVPRGANSGDR